MKITILQSVKRYKKDAIRYFISDVFDRPVIIVLLIYIVIALLYFLNKMFYLSFFPFTMELLTYSLGVGILGMLVYSVVWLIGGIRKINKDSHLLYEGKLNITMDKNGITLQTEKYNNFIKINWGQIKKILVLNDTAFFVPVDKNNYMIKINKKEIIDGNFQKMVTCATALMK